MEIQYKQSAINAIFGTYYTEKLLSWLNPCSPAFCNVTLACLGTDSSGNPNLFLSQQGAFTSITTPVLTSLGISSTGSSSLFLNQQGNFAAVSGGGSVMNAKVTMTSNQFQNAATTPVQLISAPGTGKFIQPLSIYLIYNFGTTAYTNSGFIPSTQVQFGTDTNTYFFTLSPTVIEATQNQYVFGSSSFGVNATSVSYVNQPLNFYGAGGTNWTTGDGTFTFYIAYEIITA